jgi:hypothetical protein
VVESRLHPSITIKLFDFNKEYYIEKSGGTENNKHKGDCRDGFHECAAAAAFRATAIAHLIQSAGRISFALRKAMRAEVTLDLRLLQENKRNDQNFRGDYIMRARMCSSPAS